MSKRKLLDYHWEFDLDRLAEFDPDGVKEYKRQYALLERMTKPQKREYER